MWSDEINKKIEEAEGTNNPAFNDKAWENMELLLDKHLPQEKKRRRFIFFLLPLALAGGTIFFILQQKRTNDISITDQKNIPVQPSSSADKLPENTGNIATEPSKKTSVQANPVKTKTENNLSETKTLNSPLPDQEQVSYDNRINPGTNKKGDRQTPSLSKRKPIKPIKQTETTNDNNNLAFENTVIPKTSAPTKNPTLTNNIADDGTVNPVLSDSIASSKNVITTIDKKQEDTATAEISKPEIKKEKSKTSATSKLILNLSFGPDISSVGIDNPGKLEMQYGLGVGYALSKRLTIRTGFFTSNKIYTADSGDYKTPYTINKLQKVDANCLVYEIPLNLVYNFRSVKNHNWFISGGFSSYLMKKETYGYHYENSWGQPQYYKRTYKNENAHIFSVINFSGGYQYHFTDRFSIMAEPYIKIPASGIGVGKVKLNSAGVLFTVGFKPFLKKN